MKKILLISFATIIAIILFACVEINSTTSSEVSAEAEASAPAESGIEPGDQSDIDDSSLNESTIEASETSSNGYIGSLHNYMIRTKLENRLFILYSYETQKCGMIDSNNKIIVDFIYDGIETISENRLLVQVYSDKNEHGFKKYGLIDYDGKIIVDFIYDGIEKISENRLLVHVYKNNNERRIKKHGLIDYSGKIIIDILYDEILYDDIDNRFIIKINSSTNFYLGIADNNGKIIIKPDKYQQIIQIKELFVCSIGHESEFGYVSVDYSELIDLNGNFVLLDMKLMYCIIYNNEYLIQEYKTEKYYKLTYDSNTKKAVTETSNVEAVRNELIKITDAYIKALVDNNLQELKKHCTDALYSEFVEGLNNPESHSPQWGSIAIWNKRFSDFSSSFNFSFFDNQDGYNMVLKYYLGYTMDGLAIGNDGIYISYEEIDGVYKIREFGISDA